MKIYYSSLDLYAIAISTGSYQRTTWPICQVSCERDQILVPQHPAWSTLPWTSSRLYRFLVLGPCHDPTGRLGSNTRVKANNQVFRHTFLSHRLFKCSGGNAVHNCWIRGTKWLSATRYEPLLEHWSNINQINVVKRKPSTSLANYDIKFLIAWYKVLVESTSKESVFFKLRPLSSRKGFRRRCTQFSYCATWLRTVRSVSDGRCVLHMQVRLYFH